MLGDLVQVCVSPVSLRRSLTLLGLLLAQAPLHLLCNVLLPAAHEAKLRPCRRSHKGRQGSERTSLPGQQPARGPSSPPSHMRPAAARCPAQPAPAAATRLKTRPLWSSAQAVRACLQPPLLPSQDERVAGDALSGGQQRQSCSFAQQLQPALGCTLGAWRLRHCSMDALRAGQAVSR